ncbi:MAG: hypothetical protein WD669_09575 [Pirellulales bacterium]
MIPEFNEHGLLPPGIHMTTLEEFERRFSYFASSDRRFRLFDKLRELYLVAKHTGVVKQFIVGGSFVSSKPEPADFDCILVITAEVVCMDVLPTQYNVVSRRRVRRIFAGDIFPVIEKSPLHYEMLDLFQTERGDIQKGIVEIEL